MLNRSGEIDKLTGELVEELTPEQVKKNLKETLIDVFNNDCISENELKTGLEDIDNGTCSTEVTLSTYKDKMGKTRKYIKLEK